MGNEMKKSLYGNNGNGKNKKMKISEFRRDKIRNI